MTKLYLLPLREAEKLQKSDCAAWFPARTRRAERFLHSEDRLRCLGAGALLHGILGIREDALQYNEYGKPFAENVPFAFNLSHSGSYVLLAVDEEAVGADIEKLKQVPDSVAKRVFTPEEQDWMAVSPADRFFALWTMKESAAKLLGLGLQLDPASCSVLPLLQGESIILGGQTIFGRQYTWDGHTVSVCTLHKTEAEIYSVTAEML